MNIDEYGEAINGPMTYYLIGQTLHREKTALIGWTDQNGTHLDILLVNGTSFFGGSTQGGIRGDDLFVSIMRMGAFAFDKKHLAEGETHSNYVNEKMGGHLGNAAEALTDFLRGVAYEIGSEEIQGRVRFPVQESGRD